MNISLIQKYNVPGPRYTSYPTVPYWDENSPSLVQWKGHVRQSFLESRERGISLYIHLPFCESLCTYCGCTTRITVNHAVESPYIQALLKEWSTYVDLLDEPPLIQEIHLGGGTPTFFSPANLERLIRKITSSGVLSENAELSFEAHPNNTSVIHLKTLYQLGFRRLSLGIQDFDSDVQRMINRHQSYEQVAEVTNQARQIGFTSVNYDLIFGLPQQTVETVRKTIHSTVQLQPDRIAFYSYAHVPWMKPAQKSFESYLPSDDCKRKLYEVGKQLLEESGYSEIGMDHFALPTEKLYQASLNGNLHRNFMGYTTQATRLMIGLGVSAISDTWTAFGQNVKTVEGYLKSIDSGKLPIYRGHKLTEEDLLLREHILNLMCQGRTSWDEQLAENAILNQAQERLDTMELDGLVYLGVGSIQITPLGKPFVRNVCMALDARLWRNRPSAQLFSTTV